MNKDLKDLVKDNVTLIKFINKNGLSKANDKFKIILMLAPSMMFCVCLFFVMYLFSTYVIEYQKYSFYHSLFMVILILLLSICLCIFNYIVGDLFFNKSIIEKRFKLKFKSFYYYYSFVVKKNQELLSNTQKLNNKSAEWVSSLSVSPKGNKLEKLIYKNGKLTNILNKYNLREVENSLKKANICYFISFIVSLCFLIFLTSWSLPIIIFLCCTNVMLLFLGFFHNAKYCKKLKSLESLLMIKLKPKFIKKIKNEIKDNDKLIQELSVKYDIYH